MKNIIKIKDLYTLLVKYSANFIQEQVDANALTSLALLRRRHALPEDGMAQLQALYERLLVRSDADPEACLTQSELYEYAAIITSPALVTCAQLFGSDSNLMKANQILKHLAERDLLTDAIIAKLDGAESRELMFSLLSILERDWRYEFAINIPVLTEDQYLFLLDHPDSAHAVAMCMAMFAFQEQEEAQHLSNILIEEFDVVREHLRAINQNCLEWVPYQNIRLPQQPLTRALDVVCKDELTPDMLRVMLQNLDVCEDYARCCDLLRKSTLPVAMKEVLLQGAAHQADKAYPVALTAYMFQADPISDIESLFGWEADRLRKLKVMISNFGTDIRILDKSHIVQLINVVRDADSESLDSLVDGFQTIIREQYGADYSRERTAEDLTKFRIAKLLQASGVKASKSMLFSAVKHSIYPVEKSDTQLTFKNN